MSLNHHSIARDVAYFYWLQAAYDFIDDDIDYTRFDGDYWGYLLGDIEDPVEVHWGCLAIIFAMAMHEASGVGVIWGDRLSVCREALKLYAPVDDASGRIVKVVLPALDLVSVEHRSRDWLQVQSLSADARLVHTLSVKAYFKMKANLW